MTPIDDPMAMTIAGMIRDAVRPDRIILFGSRARGDARCGSDYDIMIVGPSSFPRWRRTPLIYRLLAGLGVSKDVLWWTPEEVKEWEGVKSHFISSVLHEGIVLYEKPA
ncbi:MAG: nucleotidyltransferase domain-containing protein [Planctomycetota bacterium]